MDTISIPIIPNWNISFAPKTLYVPEEHAVAIDSIRTEAYHGRV